MQKKSDEELATIFENKDDYTAEAVEAVVIVLNERNLADNETLLKYKREQEYNEQESILKPQKIAKNYEADEDLFEGLVHPILYSKKAIQGFTIFFSTLFGTVLLMSNLIKMNKLRESMQVLFLEFLIHLPLFYF